MKTVEISEITSLLENYDETTQPFILTRNGQPIAALVPVENIDLETLSLSLNPKFSSIIEQSRRSQEEAGQIFLEDIPLPSDP
ncbi:MAG: type II toxin-antitoxin system Phd/YefM family antitoxin [Leptolyngbyaceae cyanobacterium RM2_2_4]|nr:type II toxin-antitoxin system Phd/YefM family antitoxin [Leptolyngbyaceae cyanobacterium SM1_4_3]NJO50563.1 type II toxin-antitoxin system Phd/YefM family antitoxin [Leptolyngbyaceae cyanobacterium RM2_2_4]